MLTIIVIIYGIISSLAVAGICDETTKSFLGKGEVQDFKAHSFEDTMPDDQYMWITRQLKKEANYLRKKGVDNEFSSPATNIKMDGEIEILDVDLINGRYASAQRNLSILFDDVEEAVIFLEDTKKLLKLTRKVSNQSEVTVDALRKLGFHKAKALQIFNDIREKGMKAFLKARKTENLKEARTLGKNYQEYMRMRSHLKKVIDYAKESNVAESIVQSKNKLKLRRKVRDILRDKITIKKKPTDDDLKKFGFNDQEIFTINNRLDEEGFFAYFDAPLDTQLPQSTQQAYMRLQSHIRKNIEFTTTVKAKELVRAGVSPDRAKIIIKKINKGSARKAFTRVNRSVKHETDIFDALVSTQKKATSAETLMKGIGVSSNTSKLRYSTRVSPRQARPGFKRIQKNLEGNRFAVVAHLESEAFTELGNFLARIPSQAPLVDFFIGKINKALLLTKPGSWSYKVLKALSLQIINRVARTEHFYKIRTILQTHQTRAAKFSMLKQLNGTIADDWLLVTFARRNDDATRKVWHNLKMYARSNKPEFFKRMVKAETHARPEMLGEISLVYRKNFLGRVATYIAGGGTMFYIGYKLRQKKKEQQTQPGTSNNANGNSSGEKATGNKSNTGATTKKAPSPKKGMQVEYGSEEYKTLKRLRTDLAKFLEAHPELRV